MGIAGSHRARPFYLEVTDQKDRLLIVHAKRTQAIKAFQGLKR